MHPGDDLADTHPMRVYRYSRSYKYTSHMRIRGSDTHLTHLSLRISDICDVSDEYPRARIVLFDTPHPLYSKSLMTPFAHAHFDTGRHRPSLISGLKSDFDPWNQVTSRPKRVCHDMICGRPGSVRATSIDDLKTSFPTGVLKCRNPGFNFAHPHFAPDFTV